MDPKGGKALGARAPPRSAPDTYAYIHTNYLLNTYYHFILFKTMYKHDQSKKKYTNDIRTQEIKKCTTNTITMVMQSIKLWMTWQTHRYCTKFNGISTNNKHCLQIELLYVNLGVFRFFGERLGQEFFYNIIVL